MADSRPSRIFGVTSELSGFTGFIANSFSSNETAETAEARDEKGKLLDLAPYSKSKEITLEALITTESNAAAVGSKVSIGGVDALVAGINKQESNTDFQRATLTLRQGDDDTVIHTLSEIQG